MVVKFKEAVGDHSFKWYVVDNVVGFEYEQCTYDESEWNEHKHFRNSYPGPALPVLDCTLDLKDNKELKVLATGTVFIMNNKGETIEKFEVR